MNQNEFPKFQTLLGDVYAFYRQDFSQFAAKVWWSAMTPFDFAAVSEAFSKHCVNPDNGQFMPKPADIVKMLQGSTQDSALVAWTKVDKAVRSVGTYASVAFDDPIIHRVIIEMGGWVSLGTKTEDEWPFIRNEFVNRYRGYKMRNETPEYPPVMIGIAESQNAKNGFQIAPPLLLGQPEKAQMVMLKGSNTPVLQVTMAKQYASAPALSHSQKDYGDEITDAINEDEQ
jgi:hypothetical protein